MEFALLQNIDFDTHEFPKSSVVLLANGRDFRQSATLTTAINYLALCYIEGVRSTQETRRLTTADDYQTHRSCTLLGPFLSMCHFGCPTMLRVTNNYL